MLQDLRFGLKLLAKERAFTITALLTLALCIGANTAIFTVLNAVILNPLPFPEPDRLVRIYNIYPGVGVGRGANSGPDYADRKSLTDVFESVAMISAVGYDVGRVDSVWEEFDRVIGSELLKCLHLNDSRVARGSRVDRHEWIAEGQIGPEPFRRIMRDPRLAGVVKIIETPKRDDPLRHDRRMLRRLRAYARGNRRAAVGV